MTQRENARKTFTPKRPAARSAAPARKTPSKGSSPAARRGAAASGRSAGKASKKGDSTLVYIVSLVIFFFSIFALVAVVSYFLTWREDQSIDFDSFFVLDPLEARNLMGRLGAVMGGLFVGRWFGIFGICVPVLMTILSLALFRIRVRQMRKSFVSVLMLMVTGSLAASHFWPEMDGVFGSSLGGGFGYYTAGWMDTLLGGLGTDIIILMLVCLWLVYTTHYSIVFFKVVTSSIGATASSLAGMFKSSPKVRPVNPAKRMPAPVASAAPSAGEKPSAERPETPGKPSADMKTVAAEPKAEPAPEEKIELVSAAEPESKPDEGEKDVQSAPEQLVTASDEAPSAGAFVKPEFHPQPLSERIDPLAFSKVEHGMSPNVKERRAATGKVRDDYGVPIDLDRAVLFTAPIIDDSGRLVTSDDRTLNQMSDEEIDELLSLANDKVAVSPEVGRKKVTPADLRNDDEPFIVEERPSDTAGFVVEDAGPVATGFEIGSMDDVAEEMEIERRHADDIELVIEKRADESVAVSADDSAGFGDDVGERAEFELAGTDTASFVGSEGCFDDDELVLTTNAADMLDDDSIAPSVFDPPLELSRYQLPPVELLDN
ncbi:MAG: DNA translocase FtsK 4TM domain-containing protein, partial [Rikenellaceae bacterium]|nr:DNA translocase FtsK 4TM domain-containing protein [Rikenellaceae bacterium]